ncbi:MAG: ribose-phosphate pyrophosphokinase [Deltaproteobacteria bacterium]|nr:ribose-phosphate pyrophosphokinase [Deltaproteobacteria bacterium]
MNNIKLLTGTSHPQLARNIAELLRMDLTPVEWIRFSNDNLFCRIGESIRETDVFIIQTSRPPVNDILMELYLLIDAAKYASAGRITAVLPYYPYVRSDKKDQPRIPVTARLIADQLVAAGAHHVVTMDLHSPQTLGFFRIPADHLYAAPVIVDYFRKRALKNYVIIAPDAGGVARARFYAQRLSLPMAIIDKRRDPKLGREVEITYIIGDIKGKDALIIDDEITTGNTVFQSAEALLKDGAASVSACCIHGVLQGDAISRFKKSKLKELTITDTVPHDKKNLPKNLTTLSIAPLLAEAIRRIHEGESLSAMFI